MKSSCIFTVGPKTDLNIRRHHSGVHSNERARQCVADERLLDFNGVADDGVDDRLFQLLVEHGVQEDGEIAV